jgi:hypothetical protein
MNQNETPIYAHDLMAILNFKHVNTLRLAINRGAVPPPDIQLSRKTRYWFRSTLQRAGILQPVASTSLPSPQEVVCAVANT